MAVAEVSQLYNQLTQLATKGRLAPWTKLEDGIFFGGKPGTDGMPGVKETRFPKTDAVLGVNEHAFWDHSHPNIKASLWMPIHDRPPFPGIDWLEMAVDFITDCRENGWSIYVHCSKGESRSAMVMAAYLIREQNLSVEDALMKLASLRQIKPQQVFIEGLYEWKKRCNKR